MRSNRCVRLIENRYVYIDNSKLCRNEMNEMNEMNENYKY